MNDCSNISELTETITVKDTVYGIYQSCKQIFSETVTKCFLQVGFSSEQHVDNVNNVDFHADDDITELSQQAQLYIDVETLIIFDDGFVTENIVDSGTALLDSEEHSYTESDDEENSEKLDKKMNQYVFQKQ
ncbi:hypothetical protein PGB90_009436 [Kerria lacca]